MLQGLAGEPEVLNSITVLPAGGLNLRGQAAEDISGGAIDREKRLAREAAEGGKPLLASSWVSSDLRAKSELGESHRRNEHRFALGERRHICGCQVAPLDVDPHAGIH
jgi:hypothetical protein